MMPAILRCALVLTRTFTPTPTQLADALTELQPNEQGLTVADVLSAGWLEPTVDKKRLREPPLTAAEITRRLARAEGEELDLQTASNALTFFVMIPTPGCPSVPILTTYEPLASSDGY